MKHGHGKTCNVKNIGHGYIYINKIKQCMSTIYKETNMRSKIYIYLNSVLSINQNKPSTFNYKKYFKTK